MWTHSIIKHKPVVEQFLPSVRYKKEPFKDQLEYNSFLNLTAMPGDFVVFKSVHPLSVMNEYMLNYVLDVVTDVDMLRYDHGGNALSHEMVQLGGLKGLNPYTRWTDMKEYNIISTEEVKKFINANISDNLQKFIEARKAAAEAKTTVSK